MFFNKNKPKNLSVGAKGEQIACKYLKAKGYKILETNFSNAFGKRLGEIDIICKANDILVFVEVKTRTVTSHETLLPEQNINKQKIYKLQKAINAYLRQNKLLDSNWRLDAVSVFYSEKDRLAKVKHLESIFI